MNQSAGSSFTLVSPIHTLLERPFSREAIFVAPDFGFAWVSVVRAVPGPGSQIAATPISFSRPCTVERGPCVYRARGLIPNFRPLPSILVLINA